MLNTQNDMYSLLKRQTNTLHVLAAYIICSLIPAAKHWLYLLFINLFIYYFVIIMATELPKLNIYMNENDKTGWWGH